MSLAGGPRTAARVRVIITPTIQTRLPDFQDKTSNNRTLKESEGHDEHPDETNGETLLMIHSQKTNSKLPFSNRISAARSTRLAIRIEVILFKNQPINLILLKEALGNKGITTKKNSRGGAEGKGRIAEKWGPGMPSLRADRRGIEINRDSIKGFRTHVPLIQLNERLQRLHPSIA